MPHLAERRELRLDDYLGWTRSSAADSVGAPARMFTVGILLAIMILPIITASAARSSCQVPQVHEEAALALGATRWEVIRMSVLPFGRSGIISASMLGLGRALGETMAVAIVLSPASGIIRCTSWTRAAAPSPRTSPASFDEADATGRAR